MADIFLSYASEDRERVLPLVEALEGDGFSVWWDREIRPGPSFDREIEAAIREAKCMVVVWSAYSIESEWVRSEVEEGVRTGILVPVLMDDVLPPLAHRRRQSANLAAWAGELDGEYEKLLTGIRAIIDGAAQPDTAEQDPAATSTPTHAAPRTRRPTSSTISKRSALLLTGVVFALGVGIAALAVWFVMRPEPPTPQPLVRFPVDLPAGVTLPSGVVFLLAISPDGGRIVFNGVADDGVNRIYVRSMDELEAAPIRGVENPGDVWISPDGEWVAFTDVDVVDGRRTIKKVRVSGGSPVTIAETEATIGGDMFGLTWGSDGTIVFSTRAYLMRVPDSGGTPEPLTQPSAGEFHSQPHLLADGTAVLFVVVSFAEPDRNNDNAYWRYRIAVLSLESGEQRMLTEGTSPRVTSSGHLLFEREGSIWAMAFDADRLETIGTAVPVLQDVALAYGNARFSVADDGSMVYLPSTTNVLDTLVWVDLDGHETALAAPADRYILQPRVSPDGRRVAALDGDRSAVWIHSLERNTTTRLTFDDALYDWPLWSPDGKRVIYSSTRDGPTNLYWRAADGTGEEVRLTTSPRTQVASSWSRDGQQVLYTECEALATCDLGRLTLADEPTAELFLATEFSEGLPALSPDGRWVAYNAGLSGNYQIYIRPYPDVDSGRWQISTTGGVAPLWSPDGRTLYYVEPVAGGFVLVAGGRRMMSVPIETEGGLVAGNPKALFDLRPYRYYAGRNHALDPDGERFLIVKRGLSEGGPQSLILVQNWLEEVKRLVPTD